MTFCDSSQDNGRLYQNLLELEISGDVRTNEGAVQQCVAKALAAPLSPKTKIRFSQRGLQFAEDFGTTVQRSEFLQTLLEPAVLKCQYIIKNQNTRNCRFWL